MGWRPGGDRRAAAGSRYRLRPGDALPAYEVDEKARHLMPDRRLTLSDRFR